MEPILGIRLFNIHLDLTVWKRIGMNDLGIKDNTVSSMTSKEATTPVQDAGQLEIPAQGEMING